MISMMYRSTVLCLAGTLLGTLNAVGVTEEYVLYANVYCIVTVLHGIVLCCIVHVSYSRKQEVLEDTQGVSLMQFT